MGSPTDARPALSDIAYSLRDIFRKYTRSTRKQAWKAITNTEGNKLVDKIITNPSVPIVGLPKLLHFKEWMELQENPGAYQTQQQMIAGLDDMGRRKLSLAIQQGATPEQVTQLIQQLRNGPRIPMRTPSGIPVPPNPPGSSFTNVIKGPPPPRV